MDILNNNKFYEEYLGEPEVVFQLADDNNISIHFWEGYINDIMNNQPGTEDDFRYGLSYDWNTVEGPYSDEGKNLIDVDTYIKDLARFEKVQFKYEETREAYELIMYFLKNAKENNKQVEVIVD